MWLWRRRTRCCRSFSLTDHSNLKHVIWFSSTFFLCFCVFIATKYPTAAFWEWSERISWMLTSTEQNEMLPFFITLENCQNASFFCVSIKFEYFLSPFILLNVDISSVWMMKAAASNLPLITSSPCDKFNELSKRCKWWIVFGIASVERWVRGMLSVCMFELCALCYLPETGTMHTTTALEICSKAWITTIHKQKKKREYTFCHNINFKFKNILLFALLYFLWAFGRIWISFHFQSSNFGMFM